MKRGRLRVRLDNVGVEPLGELIERPMIQADLREHFHRAVTLLRNSRQQAGTRCVNQLKAQD